MSFLRRPGGWIRLAVVLASASALALVGYRAVRGLCSPYSFIAWPSESALYGAMLASRRCWEMVHAALWWIGIGAVAIVLWILAPMFRRRT